MYAELKKFDFISIFVMMSYGICKFITYFKSGHARLTITTEWALIAVCESLRATQHTFKFNTILATFVGKNLKPAVSMAQSDNTTFHQKA